MARQAVLATVRNRRSCSAQRLPAFISIQGPDRASFVSGTFRSMGAPSGPACMRTLVILNIANTLPQLIPRFPPRPYSQSAAQTARSCLRSPARSWCSARPSLVQLEDVRWSHKVLTLSFWYTIELFVDSIGYASVAKILWRIV
jgi:hypothetical protein